MITSPKIVCISMSGLELHPLRNDDLSLSGFTAVDSRSIPIYNGAAMAKKGVVFVTINYRLDVFGFLALPQLSNGSKHHTSGNYGLLDQIAALKWVKHNISAFGGDPNNLTIDGQSAGSVSVNYLLASPLAKGLFQRAIAESCASMLTDQAHHTLNLETAEANGQKFMRRAHVHSLKALRNIPADSLMKIKGSFNPIIDGYVLPEKVSSIFAQNKQNDVPTLTGWNANEGTALSLFSKMKTAKQFKEQAKQIYGKQADKFLQYYPAETKQQALNSQYAVIRDMQMATQNYRWANVQAETGHSNLYLYYFDRKLLAKGSFKFYGAFHTGEVVYALDNLKYLNRTWQPVDYNLANIMSSYWVNFARTGNPNGKGLPKWPVYKPNKGADMELGKKIKSESVPNKAGMIFLLHFFDSK